MNIQIDQKINGVIVDFDGQSISAGIYSIDHSDKTLLLKLDYLLLPPDLFDTKNNEDENLHEFFNDITLSFKELYDAKLFFYIPSMINKKMIESRSKSLMAIRKKELKLIDNLKVDQKTFFLTTDKQQIHCYVPQLVDMMKTNAWWLTKCDQLDISQRIDSSTVVAMIIDREKNDLPIGFGRLFTNNDRSLSYISDITIDEMYQSKGLATVMINQILQTFLTLNQEEEQDGLVCLLCADRGSGMISAPKLYKKFGLEFVHETEKNVPLFLNGE